MKPLICLSVAAFTLAVSFSQPASADSFDLRVRNGNVGVGINVGDAPRFVGVVPAQPYSRDAGYWGWDGYRRVWVAPVVYGYPSRYWEGHSDYRDAHRLEEHREHEWREHERHEHESHEHHDHWG